MPFSPRKISDKLTGSPVAVINKVREYASQDYKEAVPYATNDANVLRQVGAVLYDNPVFLNEFANNLYDVVGFMFFSSNLFWKNPWKFTERGFLETGETVQEIYVGLCKPYKYNPAVAWRTWMKRETPDVKTAFHPVNSRHMYKSTIQRDSLTSAFYNYSQLDIFISEIIGQMVLSAEYDYMIMCHYLYAVSVWNGIIPVTPISSGTTKDDLQDAIALMHSTMNDFTLMLPGATLSGVKSATRPENIEIIVNSEYEASVGVKVLSEAFNLEYADYNAKRHLAIPFEKLDIERLDMLFGYMTFNEETEEWEVTPDKADEGYHHFTNEELQKLAMVKIMVCDKEVWQNYVKLSKGKTTPDNGDGLYYNNTYHSWWTLGFSPFKNVRVFGVNDDSAITSVTVNPTEATISAGAYIQLVATVTSTGFENKAVMWTSNNTNVATVDQSGLVTAIATGSATITATSIANNTKTATADITVQ